MAPRRNKPKKTIRTRSVFAKKPTHSARKKAIFRRRKKTLVRKKKQGFKSPMSVSHFRLKGLPLFSKPGAFLSNQEEIAIKPFEAVHETKIRIIGIGGGGNSIVSEIASMIKKASFVVANTDTKNLKKLSKGVKAFPFGQSLTHGLGTGMDSELGRTAGQNESERIKKILEGQDFCILVACLGGGTGSGAAPVFAKISRDLGNITYGIFTLPFKFEGEKKMTIAQEAIEKLRPYLNAITVIPNEEIFQIVDKTVPLNTALSFINKNLAKSLEGLIETIYDPGLINIDFADLRTIFQGQGRLTYLNTVEASGPVRGEEAVKKVIANPLYSYTIRGAKGILYNISGSSLGLDEVAQVSKTISGLVNKEAKIIFGVSQDKKNQDKLKITLLATGCRMNIFVPQAQELPGMTKEKGTETAKGSRKRTRQLAERKAKTKRKKRKPMILRPKRHSVKKSSSKKSLFSKKTTSKAARAIEMSQEAKPRTLPLKKKIVILEPEDTSPKPEKDKSQENINLEKKPEVIKKSELLEKSEPKSQEKETSPAEPDTTKTSEPAKEKSEASEFEKGVQVPTIRLTELNEKEAGKPEPKIRRNALQVKKATEEFEQEMISQERHWEIPTFLRRKTGHNKNEA